MILNMPFAHTHIHTRSLTRIHHSCITLAEFHLFSRFPLLTPYAYRLANLIGMRRCKKECAFCWVAWMATNIQQSVLLFTYSAHSRNSICVYRSLFSSTNNIVHWCWMVLVHNFFSIPGATLLIHNNRM